MPTRNHRLFSLALLLCGCNSAFDVDMARKPLELSATDLNDLKRFNSRFLEELTTLYPAMKNKYGGSTSDAEFIVIWPSDLVGTDLAPTLSELRTRNVVIEQVIFRSDSVVRYVVKKMVDQNMNDWSKAYTHEIVFNPRAIEYTWYQCDRSRNVELEPQWRSVSYICNTGH